jgi:hypothetical protein
VKESKVRLQSQIKHQGFLDKMTWIHLEEGKQLGMQTCSFLYSTTQPSSAARAVYVPDSLKSDSKPEVAFSQARHACVVVAAVVPATGNE